MHLCVMSRSEKGVGGSRGIQYTKKPVRGSQSSQAVFHRPSQEGLYIHIHNLSRQIESVTGNCPVSSLVLSLDRQLAVE